MSVMDPDVRFAERMFAGLRAAGLFRRDERGTMTIQILILSILLFGTTGLVLDSGRTYQMHSQMQAYADQVAMAAAMELDGKADSIDRAKKVIEGVGGSGTPLIADEDSSGLQFEIEQLVFYSEFPATTSTRQSDISFASANVVDPATGDQSTAKYVAAVVESVEVGGGVDTMLAVANALATSFGLSSTQPGNATVQALSVATRIETAQANATTPLALCNPWEGEGTGSPGPSDFYEQIVSSGTMKGRMAMYFAANPATPSTTGYTTPTTGAANGSLYPWTVKNQLFVVSGDDIGSGAECVSAFDSFDLTGGDSSTLTELRCNLASSTTKPVTYEDGRVTISPLAGAEALRGLNVIFDTYLPPFDAVAADTTPVGSVALNSFFEPDPLQTRNYQPARRLYADSAHAELDANGNIWWDAASATGSDLSAMTWSDYTSGAVYHPSSGTSGDFSNAAYRAAPQPNYSQAQDRADFGMPSCMSFLPGHYSSPFPSPFVPCTGSFYDGDANPFTANTAFVNHGSEGEDHIEDYYGISNVSAIFDAGTRASWGSFYDIYLAERGALAALEAAAGDRDHLMSFLNRPDEYGASAAYENYWSVDHDADASNDDLDQVSSRPEEYFALSGTSSLVNPDADRRKMNAVLVNCAEAVGADTTSTSFEAEVVGMVEVYLTREPAQFCGFSNPSAKVSEFTCAVDDQVETQIFVEFVRDISNTGELIENNNALLVQ